MKIIKSNLVFWILRKESFGQGLGFKIFNFYSLPILFALLFVVNANAQLTASIVKDGKEVTMKEDTAAHITSFTARIVSDDTWTFHGS
jgi:hypothetical protein